MVTKTETKIIDDIDGSTNDVKSVQFALDGATYEIDLSATNVAKLHDALAQFVSQARQVSGNRRRGRRGAQSSPSQSAPKSAETREETQAIRQWAHDNGHAVSDRGRISQAVRDAYAASKN